MRRRRGRAGGNRATLLGFSLQSNPERAWTPTRESGSQAFIIDAARAASGKSFRNCESYAVRGGRLVATEVYFGWDLPHKVPKGKHAA